MLFLDERNNIFDDILHTILLQWKCNNHSPIDCFVFSRKRTGVLDLHGLTNKEVDLKFPQSFEQTTL